jgi:hypothetical protein
MADDAGPEILSDTAIARVTLDDERGIVTFARKNAPMDVVVLKEMLEALSTALPVEKRADFALLYDMRKAPQGRPEHEDDILHFAETFQQGFVASASVFATAVGKAQATRVRRDGRLAGSEVMSSIEAALRYLDDALAS